MNQTDDHATYRLRKRLSELEAENARYRKSQSIARKYEFRITGVLLLIIGAVISVVAYPSYSLSPNANVLMLVGVAALFLGVVTMFLNTEPFISQRVAQRLNMSSVIVVDDLLRNLRVKNRGVYLPSSRTGTATKVFVPLKVDYELPARPHLAGDRAFLIDLANPAQEGVVLKPLGYHLFTYTTEELKARWREEPAHTDDHGDNDQSTPLADRLHETLVKGLEIADKVVVSQNDGRLEVQLKNTSYSAMCQALREEAPHVCEQIGCPLCSLIACIYAEHGDSTVEIAEARNEGQDIIVSYRTLA
ncbi:MAG: hypothetical protein ACXV4B_07970 [Halobacteriota archaeon]